MEFTFANAKLWRDSLTESHLLIPESLPTLRYAFAAVLYNSKGGTCYEQAYQAVMPVTSQLSASNFEVNLSFSDVITSDIDLATSVGDREEMMRTKNHEPSSIFEFIAKIKTLSFFASGMQYYHIRKFFFDMSDVSDGIPSYIPFKLFKDDGAEFGAYIKTDSQICLVKFNRKEVEDGDILNGDVYFGGCSLEPSSFEKLTTQKWYVDTFLTNPVSFPIVYAQNIKIISCC